MLEEKESSTATYYMATCGYKQYFKYDSERQEATLHGGERVTIKPDRLADFLHTAKLLGMAVGKDGRCL